MSKAFTKEDDDAADAAPPLPPRPAEPQPVTPAGLRALRAEWEALVAAGAQAQHRARVLARVLETVVETPPALRDGGAGFGCTVVVRRADGRRDTWTLVGPDEVDAARGRISVSSPMGRALLGQRPGAVVVLERPRGDEEITVEDVRADGGG